MGIPILRLTPPSDDTPTAPTKLDALGDGAELQLADSVARYSRADWEREEQAEPTCHAAMPYITIGRPSALPPDVLSNNPSDVQKLASKGRLQTTDDDIVLLVRNPTPPPKTSDKPSSVGGTACLLNDEPIRVYVQVPLFTRPWIM